MALLDYVERKEEKQKPKFSQVELSPAEFTEFETALNEDGLTKQQILKAAVKQYLAERPKKG